ncbi:hypothetical protein HanXRQr2_Chr15g0677201 [Helianthus annuus]|uniref:Uncharacterized protein n=1 Tax=Helianthus annuus TaxID=4232 RepID=A0A9K3DX63_HELAN|nr:hypothetical protein HanXRQr2_Chr15g0677201 [Helianthus annuus]KAJ0829916.1 hypothetical protein HanPSC8_Chr15g0649241 [Helianthus annuus]
MKTELEIILLCRTVLICGGWFNQLGICTVGWRVHKTNVFETKLRAPAIRALTSTWKKRDDRE